MAMRDIEFEADDDEATLVSLDVLIEFYLRYREDPVAVFTTMELSSENFEDVEDKVGFLSAVVNNHLLEIVDTRGETRFVMSDKENHTFVILMAELQAFSVSLPEEDTIVQALAEAEQE